MGQSSALPLAVRLRGRRRPCRGMPGRRPLRRDLSRSPWRLWFSPRPCRLRRHPLPPAARCEGARRWRESARHL